jgi:WD40 repeat protein
MDSKNGRSTGKEIQAGEPILRVGLSLRGSRIALGFSNSAAIWEYDTGRKVAELKGKMEAFSRDGKLAFVGNQVVEVDTGRVLFSLEEKRRGDAASSPPIFSPDGQKLAIETSSELMEVLSTTNGQPIMPGIPTPLRGPDPFARFSPDSQKVVIAGRHDSLVGVWDLRLHRQSYPDLRPGSTCFTLDISRDGRLLATGARDGEAKIWKLATGTLLKAPCLMPADVEWVMLSQDGSGLLTSTRRLFSSGASKFRYWDIRCGTAVPISLFHPLAVRDASYNRDGSLVLSVCDDGKVRLWKPESGRLLCPPLTREHRLVCAIFSPDTACLAAGSENGEVCLWEAGSGKLLWAGSHKTKVTALAFSPTSKFLASGAADGSIRVWETGKGSLVGSRDSQSEDVLSLAFDPKGDKLLASFKGYRAEILDPHSMKSFGELTKNQGWVWQGQFSHDGKWICTSSGGDAAQLWDASSGQGPLTAYPHGSGVYTAFFSSDDSKLVTASYDGTARIWDRSSGKPLTEPLVHQAPVLRALFSPNEREVITASVDRTAVIWDTRTGRQISEPFTHDGPVESACFSPDGKHVLIASADGTARIHDWVDVGDSPPPWLADLAEAVGNYQLNEAGVAEHVDDSAQSLSRLRQELAGATDGLAEWGRWYLADRRRRPMSPFASMTAMEYADILAADARFEALEDALDLGSRNPSVYQKLAEIVEPSQPETAVLYRNLAVELGGASVPATNPARLVTDKNSSGTDHAPDQIWDALDAPKLLSLEGKEAKASGRIVKFGSGSGLYFLDFAENYRSALVLAFQRDENPVEFRAEILKSYLNKDVVVRGKIINWKGGPEIAVHSLAQIEEIPNVAPAQLTPNK